MDVATQMRPTKPEPRREAFDHLSGARSLAAFWIVCAHYLPRRSEASFNGAIFRVNVAVCFFVVASGFVTHWAYGSKDFTAWSDLLRFYVRRLGRVIATFWIALVWAAYLLYRDGADLSLPYLLRCAIFLEQWFQWCPNGPSWFVFVLLPSWILYPMTRKLLFTAEEKYGGTGLFAVLVCLWLISFGPAVVLLVLHGQITMQQHSDMSFWPPAQMADFAIGMTAAAGVRRAGAEGAWRPCRLNLLADSSCLFIVLVVLVLPRPRSTYVLHLNGWEPLLDHGLSLPIAGFLLSSCVRGAEGFCARLLAHPALVSLGEVSFEVYIFQRPMHDMVSLFLPADQMEVFMIYILSLWTFAGIYSRYFQAPLDRCLRWCSEEPGPAGHAGPAGQGRQGPPRTDVIETQEYLAVPPLQESIES